MSGSGSSCHFSRGIVRHTDSFGLAREDFPFSFTEVLRLVSTALVGHNSVNHLAKISFIGFSLS